MNNPPKRRISERMKSHIPNLAPVASFCPSRANAVVSSILIILLEIVRSTFHDRNSFKIFCGRWRGDLPFKSGSPPGIVFRFFAFKKSTEKVGKHQNQPGDENPGTESRGQVKSAELGKIVVISPGHTLPAQKEHGEIEDVKSDKHNHPCDCRRFPVIHPAKHLGEPVVEGCKKTKS